MEWITNSSPKGGDKTTLQDTLKKYHLAGKFLFKTKAVLEEKPLPTFIALKKLFRVE